MMFSDFSIRRLRAVWLLAVVFLSAPGIAGVTVNGPLALTHLVQVQPIRVKKSDGSAAVVMGSAASGDYIKEQVNRVWAQSGLVLEWLPVVDYVNDFAYDGSPTDYRFTSRSTNHLRSIVDAAGSPPKNPNATVINLFFVEICPGFYQVPDGTVNGLAFVDANGIAVHVGANLVTWPGGRDAIASVLAHEIGHNLGLYHEVDYGSNLMSPYGTSERVTAAQTSTVFTDRSGVDGYEFLSPYAAPSNYSRWADGLGLVGGPADDDDHDRILNVIEFMLGMEGNTPDLHSMPAPVWGPSGLTWTLPKNSNALDDGLSYEVEVSSDGASWSPAGAPGTGSTIVTDDASTLVVRLDSGAARCLMRIKVDLTLPLAGSQTFIPIEVLERLNPGDVPVLSNCAQHGCGCQSPTQP